MAKDIGPGRTSGSKSMGVELGSVLVFAFAFFLLAALWTYHPGDPSFFSSGTASVSGTSAISGAVQNACGKVGSYIVSFLFETVGVSAFLIPAALLFICISIFRREGAARVVGTLSGMTVAVLAMTVFLTLQKRNWMFGGSMMLTGGAFGIWFVEILVRQLNTLGSSILSLCVFLVALAVSTPISVAEVGGKILHFVSRVGMRTAKILATYFSFLAGLLAMKAAQGIARVAERTMDALLSKAKEARQNAEKKRLERLETKKEQAKRALALTDTNSLEKAGAKGLPSIGNASGNASGNDSGNASAALLPATIRNKSALLTDEDEACEDGGVPLAENVLPFLSKGAQDLKNDLKHDERSFSASPAGTMTIGISGSSSGSNAGMSALIHSVPAILPHEHQKQGILGGTDPAGGSNVLGIAAALTKEAVKEKKARADKKRGAWKLPTTEFLVKAPKVENTVDTDRLYQNAEILRQKFLDFEIDGEVTAVRPGPVITLYEFKPAAGVKVSRIASLADDISMALSAQSVRIIAPLPGKSVVGIEIPSETRENVFMKEFMTHPEFLGTKHQVPVAMGKDIAGNSYFGDLAKMPHLLCAGQTGSGKSVFMNGLICSLLYRFTPDELRMILVDPKMIEFASYQDIPHLLLPVVDDSSQAASALKWAVREMERRYRILAMMSARNLAGFNEKVDELGGPEMLQETLQIAEAQVEGMEKLSGGDWTEAFEKDEMGEPRFGKLPYIVIVIDELADLMMTAKKEVELSIARIAQKARAAGIHLVIATQRPSTDVVTGIIKANLPSRVSFQLASGIDSKTILDRVGAERLLGRGDMFFIPPGTSNLLRLHGAYLSDDEISKVTRFLKDQGKPVYRNEILVDEELEQEIADEMNEDDALFVRAVELAKQNGSASASFLQRHLRVGYNRAARLIEQMESRGIVGPADGARPREVLMR